MVWTGLYPVFQREKVRVIPSPVIQWGAHRNLCCCSWSKQSWAYRFYLLSSVTLLTVPYSFVASTPGRVQSVAARLLPSISRKSFHLRVTSWETCLIWTSVPPSTCPRCLPCRWEQWIYLEVVLTVWWVVLFCLLFYSVCGILQKVPHGVKNGSSMASCDTFIFKSALGFVLYFSNCILQLE